jgi:chemotaxis protein methyltransferase CheR
MSLLKLEASEFSKLREFVFENMGIQLADGKMAMVEQRLRPLVEAEGCKSFTEFIERSLKHPSPRVMTDFVNRITTNHTYFNREPEHFSFLLSKVMPELVSRIRGDGRTASKPIFRMWCAAASRGHEPYTLAMLQRKYFGAEYNAWDAGLLATDISEKALAFATAGIYEAEEVEALPRDLRDAYMTKRPSGDYEVSRDLRRDVTYRRFNLHTASYSFRRPFEVIFCRNVLIYFDMPTKIEVVRKLASVMVPGGYLFIGLAESLGREVGALRYLSPGIYKKVG